MQVTEIDLASPARDEWDSFVDVAPAGTIFHSSKWLALYSSLNIQGERQRIICCRQQSEGKIIGGCTFLEKQRYGFRLAVNAIATQYAGFLLPPPTSEKLSSTLTKHHLIFSSLTQYLSQRFHQVWLFNAPGITDLRPLQQSRWLVSPAYTYFVNTERLESLWDQLDGSIRRQIKKGEKIGFRLTDHFQASEFLSLLTESFRRHNVSNPIPDEFIIQLLQSPTLQENRLLIGAEDNAGQLASAIVVLYDRKRAYYVLAATRSDILGSGVHSWLIWELFRELHRRGIFQFDFLGAIIPSIARFKEKFNPQLVTYYCTIYWGSLLLRGLKWLRQLIRS
ncbi:MAG: GNAT family N-acetyltransferase [Candidatus Sumerlaeia bacterium]|nr:GNAT family N-acetyltransferase [Candidatus Sumerlaeia bacterium]